MRGTSRVRHVKIVNIEAPRGENRTVRCRKSLTPLADLSRSMCDLPRLRARSFSVAVCVYMYVVQLFFSPLIYVRRGALIPLEQWVGRTRTVAALLRFNARHALSKPSAHYCTRRLSRDSAQKCILSEILPYSLMMTNCKRN